MPTTHVFSLLNGVTITCDNYITEGSKYIIQRSTKSEKVKIEIQEKAIAYIEHTIKV